MVDQGQDFIRKGQNDTKKTRAPRDQHATFEVCGVAAANTILREGNTAQLHELNVGPNGIKYVFNMTADK